MGMWVQGLSYHEAVEARIKREGRAVMSAAAEQGLLDAIWESPHDDTLRLIYADWLEETGEESNQARAELIRIQCELATMPGDDPRFDAFEVRQAELLNTWKMKWLACLPEACHKEDFDRGFPIGFLGTFSPNELANFTAERLRATPLWRYHYNVPGNDVDTWLAWPFLDRLDLFSLRPPLPNGWVERLAACDNLRNVSELSFLSCPISAGELQRVLDAWARRPLQKLRLDPLKHPGDFVGTLVNHPSVRNVRELILGGSKLAQAEMACFAKGQQLTSLSQLDVMANPFGDEGLAELLSWPALAQLRWLSLHDCGLTDAGARQLAGCPAVSNLRILLLGSNHIGIGVDGAKALADSPYLQRLEFLTFQDNPAVFNAPAAEILKKRFGERIGF
jgi:uncharacterized protein (TIGR02996 family)